MNNVILYMYLGDVAVGIEVASILFFAITLATSVITFIVIAGESTEKEIVRATKIFKVSAPLSILFLFIAIAVPSKTVMYAFAAVSAGEYVAQTDMGTMTLDLIERKLKEALDEPVREDRR